MSSVESPQPLTGRGGNVPALRFPEFTDQWRPLKVSELTKRYVDPVAVEAESIYREIGIRSHGKGLFHKDEVTGKSLGNKRVFWIKPGCFIVNIVFAWEQAVSRTTERENGFIASHRFPMYQPVAGKANTDFLVYFFMRKRGKHILELASPGGAGRNKTLGQKEFEKTKLTVPRSIEQQKIADFLTAVDTKIQQLKRKHSLMQQYKKGVMQQLFSQQVRFKDDDGRDYPDWEEKRLGKLGIFTGGGTPSTSNAAFWKGEIPWISSSDIGEKSIYEISKTRFINQNAINESATKLIPANSLLIISRVGVGKFAVTTEPVCTSQDFANFTPDKVDVIYLAYFLSFHKNMLLAFSQGTSIKGITTNDLKLLPVQVPHRDEQRKIADFLGAIDAKIQQLDAQITQAETFKKGLLQQMFV